LRLRLGGTVQDQIVYDVGLSAAQPCVPLVKDDSFISDYRGGCLSMERWIALNQLFAKTGYGFFFSRM
jgi:heparanase 1